MKKKKLWIIIAVLLVIVILAWRWIGRGPTEADDQNHPIATSAETVAAVAHTERRSVGTTLTVAGSSNRFRMSTFMPRWPAISR